jgi:DNA-binding MarR family transcriptional regulator
VDIKSWDIQKFFIVYQTFALSQIVRLTTVTLTSLSCKIKIISSLSDVQIQTIYYCATSPRRRRFLAMRAIAHELGISKNTVFLAKRRIEEYGRIVRKENIFAINSYPVEFQCFFVTYLF